MLWILKFLHLYEEFYASEDFDISIALAKKLQIWHLATQAIKIITSNVMYAIIQMQCVNMSICHD